MNETIRPHAGHAIRPADPPPFDAANPMRSVPPALVGLVGEVQVAFPHAVQLAALCLRVRRWVAGGAHLDDVRAALEGCFDPEAEGRCRYPGDLYADLARRLASLTARRKADRIASERRSGHDTEAEESLSREEIAERARAIRDSLTKSTASQPTEEALREAERRSREFAATHRNGSPERSPADGIGGMA